MNEESFETSLAHEWGLPAGASEDSVASGLAARVAWLMKHDYERLLNAVYLLDLSERRFRAAMALGSNEAAARALAELILEREREKFESRRRYRQQRSTDISANEIDEGKLPPG